MNIIIFIYLTNYTIRLYHIGFSEDYVNQSKALESHADFKIFSKNYKIHEIHNKKRENYQTKLFDNTLKNILFSKTLPSIIFPSDEEVINIISNYNKQLQNAYKQYQEDALSEIKKIIVNISDMQKNDIIKLITSNNTVIKDRIKKNFDQSRLSFDIRINSINNNEIKETLANANATNTSIIKFIRNTYTIIANNLSQNINTYNNSISTNLSNTITKANTNVYNQVVRIVNNSLNPAIEIPKIIYVDPLVLEKLIIAYSDQLYSLISVDLNTAMININKHINTQTKSQESVQNIANTKYTNSLKSSISTEINYMLQQVAIIIKNSTDSFIKQLKNDINQHNNMLGINIKKITATLRQKMIDTLKTNTSTVIALLAKKIKDNSISTLKQIEKILAIN